MTQTHRMFKVLLAGLSPLLGFALVVDAQAQSCVEPPPGLVSWWPADGHPNDVADGNNGTLQNGATFAAGHVGQAFLLDGVDDFVQVADSSSLQPSTITVDAWVNSSTQTIQNRYILSKGANSCAAASYALYTGPFGGLRFYIYNPNNGFALSPDAGSGIWDGNWHHIAGTYDGSFVRLYVDGTEVGSGTGASFNVGYDLPTSDDLFIGKYNDTLNCIANNYAGYIDEVRVFNRALSLSEIQGIFDAGTGHQFAAYDVDDVKAVFNTPPAEDVVSWAGSFTLDSESDGIDPTTDEIRADLGTASVVVSPGRLVQDTPGHWLFEDPSVPLKFNLFLEDPDLLGFTAGSAVDLSGTSTPVNTCLRIGNDCGCGMETLIGELETARTRSKSK